MADGLQDAPRHAGQVVRRVLLRRNIAIDAETAQLVADAVQAALRAGAPSRPRRRRRVPRRLRPSVLTWQARASWRRSQDDGAPGLADELSRPSRGPVSLPSPDNLADHLYETTLPQVGGPGACASGCLARGSPYGHRPKRQHVGRSRPRRPRGCRDDIRLRLPERSGAARRCSEPCPPGRCAGHGLGSADKWSPSRRFEALACGWGAGPGTGRVTRRRDRPWSGRCGGGGDDQRRFGARPSALRMSLWPAVSWVRWAKVPWSPAKVPRWMRCSSPRSWFQV